MYKATAHNQQHTINKRTSQAIISKLSCFCFVYYYSSRNVTSCCRSAGRASSVASSAATSLSLSESLWNRSARCLCVHLLCNSFLCCRAQEAATRLVLIGRLLSQRLCSWSKIAFFRRVVECVHVLSFSLLLHLTINSLRRTGYGPAILFLLSVTTLDFHETTTTMSKSS